MIMISDWFGGGKQIANAWSNSEVVGVDAAYRQKLDN
jgi:hypothetical protein